MAASKVRSAPKLAKKKQLQLVLPGTLGRHRERSGKHLASRHRETSVRHRGTRLGARGEASGRHDPGADSIWHLTAETGGHREQEESASLETQGDIAETASHRETSGRHNPGGVTASHNPGASVTAWHPTAETGRQATSIWHPASQQLASDRKG